MRKIVKLVVVSLIVFVSCKNENSKSAKQSVEKEVVSYLSFGDEIADDGALTLTDMSDKYKTLKEGDTLNIKFASSINKVCKTKGCWMNLDLGNEEEAFVNFKDYGFFMPLNSEGKEVIVEGKAFLKVTTVEELRHFAEDEGKSAEEVAKITEPEHTLAFEANGVLMKK